MRASEDGPQWYAASDAARSAGTRGQAGASFEVGLNRKYDHRPPVVSMKTTSVTQDDLDVGLLEGRDVGGVLVEQELPPQERDGPERERPARAGSSAMTVAPSMKRSGIIVTNRASRPPMTIIARIVSARAGDQLAAGGRDPDRAEQQPRQHADDEQPERRDEDERRVVPPASATGATITAEAMNP